MHRKWRVYRKVFKIRQSTRQGDPISTYLFIPVLETVSNLIKENKNIHGLTFFDVSFLYSVYADDTTLFLKDTESVKKVMTLFDTFSFYSSFKTKSLNAKFLALAS